MSTVKKCARCGLQNSFSITQHVVCSSCGAGFQLCENCVPSWKVNKCPKCGMGPANAKWQVMGGATKAGPDTSHVRTGLSASQQYDKQKEQREAKRTTAGAGQHQGVSLPAEQVTVLREIEDAIKVEITPIVPEKGKHNKFIERDGKVVELYIVPENQPRDKSLVEMIARIPSLEGLGIKNLGSSTSLAPLAAMPGFKRLAFGIDQISNDQIAGICNITQLEELNIAGITLDPPALDQHIVKLKNLKKLNIHGIRSPQNDQYPKNIGQISSLVELDISGLQNSMSKAVIPQGLENLSKIMLVHMDYAQNGLGILWGKLKAVLEQNNPSVYPKQNLKEKGLGFLKSVVSESKSMSDRAKEYRDKLPEALKKGWSGITF